MKLRFLQIKTLLAWLLLLALWQVNGQVDGQVDNTYRFLTYSNREGFTQNTVKAIEKDKTATFWMGINSSLLRNTFMTIRTGCHQIHSHRLRRSG